MARLPTVATSSTLVRRSPSSLYIPATNTHLPLHRRRLGGFGEKVQWLSWGGRADGVAGFDRKKPLGFTLGSGRVIKGFV